MIAESHFRGFVIFEKTGKKCNNINELKEILDLMTDYAVENGLIENEGLSRWRDYPRFCVKSIQDLQDDI